MRVLCDASHVIGILRVYLDGTTVIAQQMGARVTTTADWPGFGRQKNRALDLAVGDWILSIDADERVTSELASEIQLAIESNAASIFDMPRRTSFCDQWIDHCGWSPDRVTRPAEAGEAAEARAPRRGDAIGHVP